MLLLTHMGAKVWENLKVRTWFLCPTDLTNNLKWF